VYNQNYKEMRNIYKIDYDIYITSNEEIKDGDWLIVNDEDVMQMKSSYDNDMSGEDIWVGDSLNGYATYKNNCKKIILTTDDQLIQNGVQAIDDEFLEWFVKNPSCEWVEVGYGWIRLDETDNEGYWVSIPDKQFEMQQEEPKQLTVEETLLLMRNALMTFVPNNMKLYTEEQIRDALDNEDFAYIADIVIAQMQPIEIKEEPNQELELQDFESSSILNVLNMGNVEYLGNGDIIYNPNLFFIKRGDKWFIKNEEPKQDFTKGEKVYLKEDNNVSQVVDEAAEKYAESKSSNFRNTHIRDFKAGAKSDAAKEYWYKKFWEDYNSQFKKQNNEQ
jgi:hypothetical protein